MAHSGMANSVLCVVFDDAGGRGLRGGGGDVVVAMFCFSHNNAASPPTHVLESANSLPNCSLIPHTLTHISHSRSHTHFSVATLKCPCMDIPAPPPIVMPSSSAM